MWFEIIAGTIILYIAASLRIVGAQELGCILLFGKPVWEVRSGLKFVPFILCTLETATALIVQDELPADPDKIYRGSPEDKAGETVPKELQLLGFRPPIRITFSGRNEESVKSGIHEDDPYDRRLTAEVVPVVSWKIEAFLKFLTTVGSVKEARRQMEDACVSAFTDELTKVSPAVALLRKESYSKSLKEKLDKLVDGWGVNVKNAQIKAINFSHSLNSAVQRVVEQERLRAASIQEGEGLGGREKAILYGRADGLKKIRDDLGVEGAAVLGAETARAIAGEGDKSSQRTIIAGSGGFTDLIGTAVAIGESMKPKPNPTKKEE